MSHPLATAIQFPEMGTRFLVVPAEERGLALCEQVVGLDTLELPVDRAKLVCSSPVPEPAGAREDRHHPLEHRFGVGRRASGASTIAGERLGMRDEAEPGG